jgi:rhodanese-related sulfurtransferase
MKFVLRVWVLVLLCLLPACRDHHVILLDPPEAAALIREHRGRENFLILDVRTAEEFRRGHIKGAHRLDYYAPDFERRFAALDRNATILLYCRSGNRTSRVSNLAARLGFSRIFDVRGGISAWQKAGLPLVTGEEPRAPDFLPHQSSSWPCVHKHSAGRAGFILDVG